MQETIIKVLILINQQVLITQIEEVVTDLGEPDCKLIKPFVVKLPQVEGHSSILEPFLSQYTRQDIIMMSSDKILTLVDPTPTLLQKYQDIIKE